MNTKHLLGALMVSSCVSIAQADVIFYDGFEDNNANGWSLTGNVKTSGTQSIGNYSLRMKRTASATYQLSTVGYSAVTVQMQMAATALEANDNDNCNIDVSTDGGSNWTTLLTLVDGQDNATFYNASYSDSSLEDNPALQLRFRSVADDLGDYCWGDEVSVTGTLGGLTPAPEIDVTGNLTFGNVEIDTTSSKSITVHNTGDADLIIGTVTSPGTPFSVVQDNCANSTVAAGNSCMISAEFAPTSTGYFSDSISISSNDSDENPTVVSLSGTGSDQPGGGVDDFDPLTGNGNVTRNDLTFATLSSGSDPGSLVDMSAYALPANAAAPTNTFEGRLVLNNEATSGGFDEIKDTFRYTGSQDTTRKHLPEFDYELVQTGSHIVPVQRGMLANSHPEWEYILEPGRVWNENGDSGYTRVALPFALQQKNANCVHNGVMTFAFKDDGSITQVAYQIASETCLYFKVDMWGLLGATYTPTAIADAETIKSAHQAEVGARIPTKAIAELANDYPGTQVANFSNSISADHMTLFGLYIDGTNYVGGCETRQGTYPYCDVLRVPSYSTAKSNFAGVAMMRLEEKYGNVMNQTIDSYVSDCNANGNWGDVTIENAVDMATGNYKLAGYMSDEGASHTNDLFLPEDHASKISYSCTEYPRKASPGSKWIYHTSDTYIAGTAMNALVQQQQGASTDIFDDILLNEIWKPLTVGASTLSTRRTYDSVEQPFTGWGLTYNADDTVKLARFLSIDNGMLSGQQMLDSVELDAALQRISSDRGLVPTSGYYYNNGFWAKDLSSETGCSNLYVPFMSGYGGITVALLPNDTIYYYFSDNDEFNWTDAAVESHNIRSLCP
ncbi:MAG: choice-of-anchor D domain-containing protein [Aestuariibacter sp.]